MNKFLEISKDVQEAIDLKKPIVALESTLISHGLPYPENIKVANESILERSKITQTHRYITIPHKMKRVEPKVNGQYLNANDQKAAINPDISSTLSEKTNDQQAILNSNNLKEEQ